MIKLSTKRCLYTSLVFAITMSGLKTVHAQAKGWYRGGEPTSQKIQASPLLTDLNDDGKLEVVIPSFDGKLYVYKHDGTAYSGWPKTTGFSDGSIGSVSAGDVDGDGSPELVLAGDNSTGKQAKVEVYEINGTLLASVALNDNSNASGKATAALINCQKYSSTTLHPAEEIILRDGDGKVQILVWNGSSFTNRYASPLFDTCSANSLKDRFGAQPITPSVSVYTASNGDTRIVAPSTDGKVYRWNVASESGTANNWNPTQLTSFQTGDAEARFYGSAAIADLDDDGSPEIIVGATNGAVYAWHENGTLVTGWPQWATQDIVSSPAIADIDQDGAPDIVVGSDDGWIYAWDASGTPLPGWPFETRGDVFSSVAVADIDTTAGLEVVAASLDGRLYALGSLGTPLFGWPKVLESPLYSSPAVGDLHGSGRLSIVTCGFDGRIFVFDLPTRSPDPNAGWKQFRGGAKRQGRP